MTREECYKELFEAMTDEVKYWKGLAYKLANFYDKVVHEIPLGAEITIQEFIKGSGDV